MADRGRDIRFIAVPARLRPLFRPCISASFYHEITRSLEYGAWMDQWVVAGYLTSRTSRKHADLPVYWHTNAMLRGAQDDPDPADWIFSDRDCRLQSDGRLQRVPSQIMEYSYIGDLHYYGLQPGGRGTGIISHPLLAEAISGPVHRSIQSCGILTDRELHLLEKNRLTM